MIIVLCSHYCCMAQDFLNGDQLTDQFNADLEKCAFGKKHAKEK